MSSDLDAGSVDRISDLPKSIIGYILSFLRTKDAVATSLLSKSWKLIWTTEVTTFDMEATDYVDKVLGNMNVESISKFCLSCPEVEQSIAKGFDASISAIPRMVKALKVLDLASNQLHATELPAEIFNCKNLEVLKLDGRFIIKLPRAVCVPKLAELELNWVDYHKASEMTVSELISTCPVLQSLTIKKSRFTVNDRILTVSSLSLKRLYILVFYAFPVDRKLTIDAPSLEYLFLNDLAANNICIRGGLPFVNEVDLWLDLFCLARADQIVALLESFHVLKILKLSDEVMSALDKSTKKLSARFEKLTTLAVEYHLSSHESNQLVGLMDRCVNLQVLKVSCGVRPCWPSPIVFPRCLSSSLQTLEVTFKSIPGEYDLTVDLKMIEFILNHGLELERVHLCFDFDKFEVSEDIMMDKILKKVSMMPKASQTCKIFHRTGRLGALKPLLPQQSIKVRIGHFQHMMLLMSHREKWATGSKNRYQYRCLR